MATKAELEAEVQRLREQLSAQEGGRKAMVPTDRDAADTGDGLPGALSDLLAQAGIDGTNVEAVAKQLSDELSQIQKDYPLLTLLGIFVLGCLAGRATK